MMWFCPDDNEIIRQNLSAFSYWIIEKDVFYYTRQIKFHFYKWENARKRYE